MATVFTQRAASHLRGAAPRFALQAHAGNLVAARQAPSFAMAQQRGGFRSASLQKSTPTWNRRSVSVHAMASLVDTVKEKNAKYPVIVYSKTYCPYCAKVKALMVKLEVDAKIVELDEVAEGNDVQAALLDITGQTTVPQVFIGGTFIGGADDTLALHRSGKLKDIFADAGIQSTL